MNKMKEHDVTVAYTALKKAIRRGDYRSATLMVQNLLATQDPAEVWKFLLTSASSEISHNDQLTPISVRTLYENWELTKNPVFAVHAVLALIPADKGTSAMDYITRRTD